MIVCAPAQRQEPSEATSVRRASRAYREQPKIVRDGRRHCSRDRRAVAKLTPTVVAPAQHGATAARTHMLGASNDVEIAIGAADGLRSIDAQGRVGPIREVPPAEDWLIRALGELAAGNARACCHGL